MKVPVLIPRIFNYPLTYNSNSLKSLKQGDLVQVKIGKSSGDCKIKVSSTDWWADATKNLSTFLRFFKPWNITLVFKVILKTKIIKLAKSFPNNKVDFFGSTRVGIAIIKTTITTE